MVRSHGENRIDGKGNDLLYRALVVEFPCAACRCGQEQHLCLFDLILYVPSTIFQLNRDGSSWLEPVLR